LKSLPPLATHPKETPMNRETFGLWLLSEKGRGDWIDDLADAARADRKFPKDGTPDDVRKRLSEMGAEGDMFERVDDAEAAWINAGEL
jgi:hypothetical protein